MGTVPGADAASTRFSIHDGDSDRSLCALQRAVLAQRHRSLGSRFGLSPPGAIRSTVSLATKGRPAAIAARPPRHPVPREDLATDAQGWTPVVVPARAVPDPRPGGSALAARHVPRAVRSLQRLGHPPSTWASRGSESSPLLHSTRARQVGPQPVSHHSGPIGAALSPRPTGAGALPRSNEPKRTGSRTGPA